MDSKYKYSYEKTFDYCYQGTDILINKLNITKYSDLCEAERTLVLLRTYEFNEKPLKGNFDFDHLKKIHKYLFQDIYPWAGSIRHCNIAKQDLFCLSENIESFAEDIFKRLKEAKYFVIYEKEVVLEKLATLFADINALHAFREGNGRTQRLFIEMLAKINGINLDLTSVSKEDMIIASHESINGNIFKLKKLFIENSSFISNVEKFDYINMYALSKSKNIILNNLII